MSIAKSSEMRARLGLAGEDNARYISTHGTLLPGSFFWYVGGVFGEFGGGVWWCLEHMRSNLLALTR